MAPGGLNNTTSSDVVLTFVRLIATSIVYAWIYNSTQGSLLIVMLAHAGHNLAVRFVPLAASVRHGSANGLRQDGKIAEAAQAARHRGVLFDVGHGAGSFDFEVAEAAARVGFWPDTISTDIHSISAPKVIGLPAVMSKLLAVGMPLKQVISAATTNAARAIGCADSLGSLREGAVADIAVLDLETGPVEFADTVGHHRTGQQRLNARYTIRAGVVWGVPAHPGTGVAVMTG